MISYSTTNIIVILKSNISYGVPQGSILGPLLFFLYINDIRIASKVLKFHLVADDTNNIYSDKNSKRLELVVNSESAKLQDWFTANKLTISMKKSNFVIFHQFRMKQKLQVNIKLTDYKTSKFIYLEQKDSVKYLGVLLDNKLFFETTH